MKLAVLFRKFLKNLIFLFNLFDDVSNLQAYENKTMVFESLFMRIELRIGSDKYYQPDRFILTPTLARLAIKG